MLLNYTFSNFRSFKDKTSLTMRASSQTTLNENLIREKGLRVIPSAVIYGANASGKSNIIMSLDIMKELVLAGSLDANTPELANLELYPFAHSDEDDRPMSFEIEFIHKGFHLIYGFEILCPLFRKGSRKVVSEGLSLVDSKLRPVKLYDRDSQGLRIMKDRKALEAMSISEPLGPFEKRINANLDAEELFLSRAFKSIISSELAEIVIDFFKDGLVVASDFTLKQANLTFSRDDMPKRNFVVWNRILDAFVKGADFGPQSIAFKPGTTDNGDSADMELVSIYRHRNHAAMIPAELMESRGTLKLLDFAIPFEALFNAGGVFVFDEFDAAIHPELVKGIISIFNDQDTNLNGAQLVFTTHNPIYLNNRIFRRDQIRFVEKDPSTYKSVIYSLADLGSEEVRNDHNFLLNYFKGNYGALPFMDFSKLLTDVNSKEEA